MEEEKEKVIRAVGYFDGYKSKSNYDVEINFKFPDDELANALQFIAGIGKKLSLVAITGEEKNSNKLGTFTVYRCLVDKDANTKVRFKSNLGECFPEKFLTLAEPEDSIVLKARIVEEKEEE